MTDRIEAYIEENQPRFIEELKEFMRFPSVSAQRAHDGDTRACAEWLVAHLVRLGFDAQLIDVGGQPIVRAAAKGKASRRAVIYGHYDVQPEDPLDEWKTPPFEPTIRDGILYGRGATDDKGQLFAHVKAVESLLATEGRLPCEVVFLIEGEEESGGDALPRYIKQARAELACDAVIVSDSTMYDADTPAITNGLRGILAFEFTIKGPNSDVHSGAYGGAVANPAMVVAQMLAACVSPEGKVLIPHFYDDVAPLEDWEREGFGKLAFDDGALARELDVPRLHGEPGYSTLERLWARPTFEVNGIFGGYQGQRSKTIIPASATAKISIRLVPHQDPARVRDAVFAHLRAVCPDTVRLEIPYSAMSPPVLFDVNTPVIRAAEEALRQGFGREPAFIRCGGSIPVVSTFVEQLQCPVVLMGFGLDSDRPHGPNEHFSLDSFRRGTKAAAHLLRAI
ncbi:MAG: dipeptidase [Sedimentisphaerales bacterium]|jgi:acetylornithine deacetylase/succinyl-diaminopimelate desuccinylase-like protein|nr:dipeptidase [Sedimentisphaerales bacterium]